MVKSMLGKKTMFYMADKVSGTQTYTQVANVRAIGDVSVSATSIDVTEYGEGMNREYIAGLGETTDMTLTLASMSPSVEAFETAFDNATEQAIKIVLPSGKVLKFDGVITGYSYSIPVDGAYQFNATIKPSGKMTRAYQIAFDANGGEGTMDAVEAALNGTVTVPACTFTAPAGKSFASYNTQKDGQGTTYNAADTLTVTGAVTLFAIYN